MADTPFEIHMYSAVARATPASGFPDPERHPLLIFLRQKPHAAHEMGDAAHAARTAGWTDVDITRAGTLPSGAQEAMDGPVRHAWQSAVDHGAGVMAFDAVVQPAPRKE